MRALKLRDHDRCRFPGCPHQRYVEAHHIQHWIDGGETRLDNLVLLCSAHHRLLHHGAFHVAVEDGDVVFVSRDGEVIEPALRPQFGDVSGGVSEETRCSVTPLREVRAGRPASGRALICHRDRDERRDGHAAMERICQPVVSGFPNRQVGDYPEVIG